MHHNLSAITTIAAALGFGLLFGMLALRLRAGAALRYPIKTAATVSASLAQIGEFSFILAAMGMSLGLLPVQGQNLILAGAIMSIAFNPLLFKAVEPLLRCFMANRSLRAT